MARISEIATEVNRRAAAADAAGRFSSEALWHELADDLEVELALWMNEVQAYGTLVFAYEAFLIHVLKDRLGSPSLRSEKISDALRDNLGDAIRDACWTNVPMDRARKIRHALVHNGRRPTSEVAALTPPVLLEGGEIVVKPGDTVALFGVLSKAANSFANAALGRWSV